MPPAAAEQGRDQRGGGIVSEAESFDDSRSNGDHVFERSSKFDADYIVARVNPKHRIAEFALHAGGNFGVRRCNGECSRISSCDFLGKARPAQSPNARYPADLGSNFRHAFIGFVFDTFCGTHDERIARNRGSYLLVQTASMMGRHYRQYYLC